MLSEFFGPAQPPQQFLNRLDRAIGRGALVRYATQANAAWDRDDLVQDVAEHLLRRGAKLDLSRGSADDFIYMLGRSRADHHLRALKAARRDHQLEVRPEAEPASGETDDTHFAFDKVTFEVALRRHQDEVRRQELAAEFEAATAELAPKDQAILEALNDRGTVAAVARAKGLAESTVRDALKRVVKVYRRRGLDAYVEWTAKGPARRAS